MKALNNRKSIYSKLFLNKRHLLFCFLLIAAFSSGCNPKDNAFRIPKFIPTTCIISHPISSLF